MAGHQDMPSEEMEALASTLEATKNSFTGMSEKEMKDHLQLCMKLSVENKINSKNAFGLHLIGILPMLAKDKTTDLQTASLSLQASSKIYCGRVDALYKETFQFHNHLQTILSDGKKSAPHQDMESGFNEEDGPSERAKTTQKKKLKSYVATEESITINSQADKISAKPHQNFELIKSAFSGASVAKKLLNCLQFENDSCETKCGRSSKIYKQRQPVPVVNYTLTQVEKKLWQKMADWEVVPRCDEMDSSINFGGASRHSLPMANMDGSYNDGMDQNPPEFNGNSPVSFDMGCNAEIGDARTPVPVANDANDNSGLNILNERLGALDITACSFANDISQALNRDGSINPALLPPQSALRKVLKTTEKVNLRKEGVVTEKKKREVKPREPFFRGQAIDKTLFLPGKRNVLSDAAIADWDKSETTELGTGFDAFHAELDVDPENVAEILEECQELFDDVASESNPCFKLQNPFLKKPVWKLFREVNPVAVGRKDSPGIFRRVQSMVPPPEHLVESFRNMTINDSFDNMADGFPNDAGNISIEEQVVMADFADDLQLVAPPELVKPINVRPQQKAMNFDTQKIKQSMWGIISSRLAKDKSALFSTVVDELNKEMKKKDPEADNVAWQFGFVMILVLANEKVLLIENVEDGKDMIVTQDISEDVESI